MLRYGVGDHKGADVVAVGSILAGVDDEVAKRDAALRWHAKARQRRRSLRPNLWNPLLIKVGFISFRRVVKSPTLVAVLPTLELAQAGPV